MKKLFLIGLCLAGSGALAVGSILYAEESQSTTRSAPALADFTVTSGSTLGKALDLTKAASFRVLVCAESGQTLSGGGNLRAYLLDERSGLVHRNPTLDLAVSATTRCQAFPDQDVSVPAGRVIYAADTVTVSGGTTVTVSIRGLGR